MKFRLVRFNTYFCLILGVALGGGCQTSSSEKKAPKTGYRILRLHLEVNADGSDRNSAVTVGRQSPFQVNVEKEPFLDEQHLVRASVVDDDFGGFSLRVQFNRQGTWLLEQCTVANKGRRIAVFSELDKMRWLGAPLITKRLGDGVFTFTPDASREDAEKLVLGLNGTVKKLRNRTTLNDELR
jgi:preprotein translocase subunit SecD